MMHPMSAEATVVRNYIDWVLALPWYDKTEEKLRHRSRPSRSSTRTTTACKKVKERILEYLAVQALVKKLKGPILCLVGPPGVGKTSLAQVDRARDRPQVRAPVARRRARRGGDPRPPPHVHRRAARQDHPVAEEGRHATTRSSCSTRSTRCRPTSAATRRRRCSRCSTPSRTTPSTITTSISTTTCRDVMFITTANYAARASRCRCRTAWRSSSSPATPSSRSSNIAEQYLIPQADARTNGLEDVDVDVHRERDPHDHPPLHAGSRRP